MIDATPLLRLYAARRRRVLESEDAVAAQERVLAALIARAKDTRFGRTHRFSEMHDIAGFQARVPVRSYEAMWDEFWRAPFPALDNVSWPGRMPFFALSSGTTSGRTKYIPVSHDMVAANRRAALDILVHHLAARADTTVLAGRSFMLGGSTALETLAPGVRAGDLSGIATATVPFWARGRTFPPPELALETDWERKIAALVPASLAADVRAISGTPTWLLAFFERLARHAPRLGPSLSDFYPNLELVIHGGVAMAPYRRRFERLIEGTRVRLAEVYPASEGFFAIQDGDPAAGMRLLVENGIFYEFVEPDTLDTPSPRRHTLAQAALDTDYALVVSTDAGLFAYAVGDLVRLVSKAPPRIVFAGRTAYTLSAFGEHVSGAELEGAMMQAAQAIEAQIVDYSAGARHRAQGAASDHHIVVVEFVEGAIEPARAARLRDALDAALVRANADYAAHREARQLAAPEVLVAPAGTFHAWMAARGKLGGQNKAPRVISDVELFASLERAASSGTRVPASR